MLTIWLYVHWLFLQLATAMFFVANKQLSQYNYIAIATYTYATVLY